MTPTNPKRVLITGASRGIGQACACLFAKLGYSVVLVARNRKKLQEVLGELDGAGHELIACDLTSKLGQDFLVKEVLHKLPDLIIHCLGGRVSVGEGQDPWQDSLNLNFLSIVRMNEKFIPKLVERKVGTIVHLSSSAALNGQAFTPYACAKAALNRYVVDSGQVLLADNICLFAIMPPAVEGHGNYWAEIKKSDPNKYSKMVTGQKLGRPQTTDEVSEFIYSLVTSQRRILGGCLVSTDPTIY
ncbi:SDR family NAD(P)-dependent oxidoreductase [Thalassotalea marina]|uniref:Short-chain dehydrogenase n=1 Tax=Thalassotalea marina TaxID=1673741 RepID=A0A919EHX5_9GAMM|nr:SDR family NAD(P)-dependent oxidoreductase [Thalassotalea marina]GHF80482.1 short-chain dehydrogenase [Thalassotalea marina]